MVFRVLVDSNWCADAVLEKKMHPLPLTLALGTFLSTGTADSIVASASPWAEVVPKQLELLSQVPQNQRVGPSPEPKNK
jgi:hypothetical protein